MILSWGAIAATTTNFFQEPTWHTSSSLRTRQDASSTTVSQNSILTAGITAINAGRIFIEVHKIEVGGKRGKSTPLSSAESGARVGISSITPYHKKSHC